MAVRHSESTSLPLVRGASNTTSHSINCYIVTCGSLTPGSIYTFTDVLLYIVRLLFSFFSSLCAVNLGYFKVSIVKKSMIEMCFLLYINNYMCVQIFTTAPVENVVFSMFSMKKKVFKKLPTKGCDVTVILLCCFIPNIRYLSEKTNNLL